MWNLAFAQTNDRSHDQSSQPRALRSAMELRYQVYCIESNFLCADDYPDNVEFDEHDRSAAHFYAFDAHEELVGYVRLIRPDVDQRFPIETRCVLSIEAVARP